MKKQVRGRYNHYFTPHMKGDIMDILEKPKCKKCQELQKKIDELSAINDILNSDVGLAASQITMLAKELGRDISFHDVIAENAKIRALIKSKKVIND